MMSDQDLVDMDMLAAAGTIEMVPLSEERAIFIRGKIIDNAPVQIKDDFELCCAYYLYRIILMGAVENKDVGQILNAQSAILGLIT